MTNLKSLRAIESAKRRLGGLGKAISECKSEASVYAACVARKENISQYTCEQEFQAFKTCITNATKKLK